MEISASKAVAMVMAGVLCVASSNSVAKGKPGAVRYPAILQGIWLGEGREYCKHPDSLDSDSRFEITPINLIGYEHWNKPLRIVQISKAPMAWKVLARSYFDGSSVDMEDIYVLSSKARMLTVVSDGHTMAYYRCE